MFLKKAYEKHQLEEELKLVWDNNQNLKTILDNLPVQTIQKCKEELAKAYTMFMDWQTECDKVYREQNDRLQVTIPARLEEEKTRIENLEKLIPQLSKKIEAQKQSYRESCKKGFVYLWYLGAQCEELKKKKENWKKEHDRVLGRYQFENKLWSNNVSTINKSRREKEVLQERNQELRAEIERLKAPFYSSWWNQKKDDTKKKD